MFSKLYHTLVVNINNVNLTLLAKIEKYTWFVKNKRDLHCTPLSITIFQVNVERSHRFQFQIFCQSYLTNKFVLLRSCRYSFNNLLLTNQASTAAIFPECWSEPIPGGWALWQFALHRILTDQGKRSISTNVYRMNRMTIYTASWFWKQLALVVFYCLLTNFWCDGLHQWQTTCY